MSYHGLGLELRVDAGPILRATTGTSAPAPTTTSASWVALLALRMWLPMLGTAMGRLRSRVAVADRAAAIRAATAVGIAIALVNDIYNYETQRGTRAFRAWSSSSLRRLGDISRSGGIPDAVLMALITRSRDAAAIRAATNVRTNWGRLASLVPRVSTTLSTTTLRTTTTADETARRRAVAEAEAEAERRRAVAMAAMEEARRVRAVAEAAAVAAAAEARRLAEVAAEAAYDTVPVIDEAKETVEDVIEDVTTTLPTLEQLTPGTTASREEIGRPGFRTSTLVWIGVGVLGVGAVGYLLLGD